MEENKKPPAPSPPAPKFVGHGMAMDSAEHLFAAFPVLVAIANLTGKIGSVKPAKLAGLPPQGQSPEYIAHGAESWRGGILNLEASVRSSRPTIEGLPKARDAANVLDAWPVFLDTRSGRYRTRTRQPLGIPAWWDPSISRPRALS